MAPESPLAVPPGNASAAMQTRRKDRTRPQAPHLVHITPSFGAGGAQVRMAQLMNHFGAQFRHTILSIDPDLQAADRLQPDVDVTCQVVERDTNPVRMSRHLRSLLQTQQPDLVLTYNWGAIDGVPAARLVGAPVIHTEDGFGHDEAAGQKAPRVWYRRLLLPLAFRVVAPSLVLERIMKGTWWLGSQRVNYIPNGVDLSRYRARTFDRPSEELVLGTAGHLRPEKRQDVMIELCAALAAQRPVRLLIAGDGPERQRLQERAAALGITKQVELLGYQSNLQEFYQRLDLFVLTSSTEQMPLSVLEAMASGLPVLSTAVGDVCDMVATPNRPYVVAAGAPLFEAAEELAARPVVRWQLGAANREYCERHFSLPCMFERYATLYQGALGARG